MSWKSLFLNEEPAAPAADPSAAPVNSLPPAAVASTGFTGYAPAPGATYAPVPVAGVVDQKYINHFDALLAESNFAGTDYYEFAMALKTMRSSGLPEPQLFLLTFQSMAAMNLDTNAPALVAKLLDTAAKYIEIINQNKVQFEQDVQEAQGSKVGTLQSRMEQLGKENGDAAEQIRLLQEKIQANTLEITKLSEEMSTQNSKLVSSHNNYNATHAVVVGGIASDMEKIKLYLQTAPAQPAATR